MLILTSDGLSSGPLLHETGKYLSSGTKTAAMITTASVGYKERDWHVPKLTEELESLNLAVDYFDLEVQPPESLLSYDVIELIGGNPFYLLKQMRLAECRQVFQELMNGKIIIGISAGSLVLQKDISLIAQLSPELNEETALADFTGLHLTDVDILPHYYKMMTRIPDFKERVEKYEAQNRCEMIRLDDGQGVFVSSENFYVV